MTSSKPFKTPPPDHPLANLFVNIILPVLVLNKGTPYFGAKAALIVAVSLPLAYGLYDYVRNHHKNYVSLLGLFNIALTGSLALLSLHGMWFAVKEAMLPLTLGILVYFSARTENPAAQVMFCNPRVLNMRGIEEALNSRGTGSSYTGLVRTTTIWLSVSFFISAILNFGLAMRIFKHIDSELPASEQSAVLNQQIANMTWMSMLVIALPLMVFSGVLITWFLRKLVKLTGLPMDTLMKPDY